MTSALYYPRFADPELFAVLRDVLPWSRDISYCGYSRTDLAPPYDEPVAGIANLLRAMSDFNHCVPQRYRAPWNAGPWHTDPAPISDEHPIAIVSFGEARVFETSCADEIEQYTLEPGSLLVMPPGFQKTHLHRLAPMSTPVTERISCTFTWRLRA